MLQFISLGSVRFLNPDVTVLMLSCMHWFIDKACFESMQSKVTTPDVMVSITLKFLSLTLWMTWVTCIYQQSSHSCQNNYLRVACHLSHDILSKSTFPTFCLNPLFQISVQFMTYGKSSRHSTGTDEETAALLHNWIRFEEMLLMCCFDRLASQVCIRFIYLHWPLVLYLLVDV